MEADGRIVITPKNKAEAYALKKWTEEFGQCMDKGIFIDTNLVSNTKKEEQP